MTFNSKTTERPKIFFLAIFIVLWPYLLTDKLRCLQKNNIGHTNVSVERELRTQGEEAGGGAKKFSRQISSNGTLMTRAKL